MGVVFLYVWGQGCEEMDRCGYVVIAYVDRVGAGGKRGRHTHIDW